LKTLPLVFLLVVIAPLAAAAPAGASLVAMAARGIPEAQYLVGIAYRDGNGVPRKPREAMKMLRFASRQGHLEAGYAMAVMFRDGNGVVIKEERAVTLFAKGAQDGHAASQLALAEMMLAGRGTAQDDAVAAQWLDRATKQNLAAAQGLLGELVYDGRGISKSPPQAYFLLSLARDAVSPRGARIRDELRVKLNRRKKAEIHGMIRSFRTKNPPTAPRASPLGAIPLLDEIPEPVVATPGAAPIVLSAEQEAQLAEAEGLVAAESGGGADAATRALALTDAVRVADPGNLRAEWVRGRAFSALGRDAEARGALQTYLEREPGSVDAHLLLGLAELRLGNSDVARRELTRVLQLDSARIEARRALARVHAMAGDPEAAVIQAWLALETDPNDLATRKLLVENLLVLDRAGDALRILRAIPEEERDAEVYARLGLLQLELGQRDEARRNLTRAEASRPGVPETLTGLLTLDAAEGRTAESILRIDAALLAHPEDAVLQRARGLAAEAAGSGAEAEAHFQRALALDPSDGRSARELARFQVRNGRPLEALRTYELGLAASPADADLHAARASLLLAQGDREAAIESYEAAIGSSATHVQSRNELAYLLAGDRKRLDRALELAEEARILMPGSPEAAATLGKVYFERDDVLAAIRYLRQAETGLDPHDPRLGEVRYLLGASYVADGDLRQGREALVRALESAPRSGAQVDPAWVGTARETLSRLGNSR
jgi:tetratricopeptide (TPR) repeat protein